jgi:hypothetical protein
VVSDDAFFTVMGPELSQVWVSFPLPAVLGQAIGGRAG